MSHKRVQRTMKNMILKVLFTYMLWSIGMNESEATLLLGPVSYNYPPWSLFSMNPRPFKYQATKGMPPSPLMIHSTPSNNHKNIMNNKCNFQHLQDQINELKDELKKQNDNIQRIIDANQLKNQPKKEMLLFRTLSNSQNPEPRLNGYLVHQIIRPYIRTAFQFRKSSSLSSLNTPITFDIEDYNKGNAFNGKTGIFKTPRTGFYFFSFNGMTDGSGNSVSVVFQINSINITTSLGSTAFSPLNIQTVAKLNANDLVVLQLATPVGAGATAGLYEDGYSYFTRFMGFSLSI